MHGLRLTKTVDNEQIYYINDGDNVIAELYEDEVTAYYLRGLNLYGAFIGNDEYFYLYNAHGDVVNLTDTSGYIEHTYRYDAFGNEREPESSDNNPFRYCGEYYDGETGSYYLRARYYDPVVGRFTQQDSYRGDTTDPLSLNYYVYCASNPLAYHDPSGNYWETAFDIASFGISLGDFLSNPTLYNASFLAWDAIALVSPAPSVGLIKGIDEVDDVFALLRRTDDSIDAVKAVKEVASSKVLRTNMIKNGSEVPKYKHAAHHIVAGNAKEASYARSVLEKFNISINDAVNGVFLPTEKNVSNAMYHPSLHTKAYYEQVNKMLSKANSSDDVRAILEDIGEMLEYGDFNVLK